MRIGIVGCRDYTPSVTLICEAVDMAIDYFVDDVGWHEPPQIVTGDCPTGVDAAVRLWEPEAFVHKADWKQFGAAAGPIRNRKLVNDVDILVAFWDGRSRGTRNAIESATLAKRPVLIFPTEEEE